MFFISCKEAALISTLRRLAFGRLRHGFAGTYPLKQSKYNVVGYSELPAAAAPRLDVNGLRRRTLEHSTPFREQDPDHHRMKRRPSNPRGSGCPAVREIAR